MLGNGVGSIFGINVGGSMDIARWRRRYRRDERLQGTDEIPVRGDRLNRG